MKRYKQLLALLLAATITLALLAGCSKKGVQTPVGTISDFESQAHVQVGTSEDASASGDTSREPPTGEFVVSDKKYDYKDANLVLLYVENQTNRHYNVTIKGKYLDENGETIQEETQTFEGFPSGWSNHFIFYPKVAFDSFTYALETEEYTKEPEGSYIVRSDDDGNLLTSYIDLTYEKKLFWQRGVAGGDEEGHSIESRDLLFYATLANSHPSVTISAEFHVLVLDAQGEIYLTDYDYAEVGISGTATEPVGSEDNGKHRTNIMLFRQEPKQDESIPENVQGVFTAIFAITNVIDYDKFIKQFK